MRLIKCQQLDKSTLGARQLTIAAACLYNGQQIAVTALGYAGQRTRTRSIVIAFQEVICRHGHSHSHRYQHRVEDCFHFWYDILQLVFFRGSKLLDEAISCGLKKQRCRTAWPSNLCCL